MACGILKLLYLSCVYDYLLKLFKIFWLYHAKFLIIKCHI